MAINRNELEEIRALLYGVGEYLNGDIHKARENDDLRLDLLAGIPDIIEMLEAYIDGEWDIEASLLLDQARIVEDDLIELLDFDND